MSSAVSPSSGPTAQGARLRVLLLTPYSLYRRWPTTPDTTKMVTNGAPVTLAQLAAMIPEHEVRIFDGNVYTAPLGDFVALVRWADLIAMNAMSTYAALNIELNLRFIRRVAPGRPIVLGGHHATFYRDEWMARGVDAIVRREGEHTFQELVRAFARGEDWSEVAGLTWRDAQGYVRANPDRPFCADLDSLPLPAWDLVDWSGYDLFLRRKGYAACLESSRGCSHRCQFCQVGPMWRHTHRWKSPERVVEELTDLHARGVRQLVIVDDDYGDPADAARQHAIYDAWEASGVDMEWGTFMRADYVLRNPDLIERGARLGLCYAWIGFETVSERWLHTIGKEYRFEQERLRDYQAAYRIMRTNGVLVAGFLVVGYPGQRLEEMQETLRLAHTFCDYPVVTFYKPLKGTAGYRQCERQGLLAKDTFYHDSRAATVLGTEGLLSVYNRYFLGLLLDPRHLAKVAWAPSRVERDLHRALYAWFARGAAGVRADNVADWLACKLHGWRYRARGGEPSQALIDRLNRKYLSRGWLDDVAGPFGAQPARLPSSRVAEGG